jgi:hypothetical protein
LLCETINRILKTQAVPAQWLANYIQLIPKPKGGDRPITVTSALYSLVMGIFGTDMDDRQEAQQAFWEDAVTGSSALQAALQRRLLDELHGDTDQVCITGYCDLENFYDSIDVEKLIHHALDSEFPPQALAVLMQVHLSTRLLRVNKWVSEPVPPCTSIIAGCKASGQLARVLLYPILARAHEQMRPEQIHFRCYVDDLVLCVTRPTIGQARATFVDLFTEVMQQLAKRNLTHSQQKTVVRSNHPKAATAAVADLLKDNITVMANAPVTDLGTPVGTGRNRMATQANKRLAANHARARPRGPGPSSS